MVKLRALVLIILVNMICIPLITAEEPGMEQPGKEINQTLVNETIEKVKETAMPAWLSSVLTISLLAGFLIISYKYLGA